MATAKLINNIFLVCLSSFCLVAVNCSRADLGTYLHIKELPGSEEKHSIDSYVLAYINYTYNTSDGREMHISEDRARYGEGKIMNVQGTLVHVTSEVDVNDHTACSPVVRGTRGMPLPGPGKPWIALVKRGTCTFEEKIKHVYRYRAVGVIVYNEESSVSLEKMKINDKERNITAIFTYKVIGEQLARILEDGTSMWVSITEGQRGMKSLANINKTSVLFVSISFIVLMIISLVWLIFYYVQRFRYLQSKDQHSRHLCTVAKRIIMKIPTKSGKCEDKDSENDCCAICIELYKATDCIRVLPCKHEFHKNCIDPWLLEHRTCPMCKLDVLKHYGFVFLGSEESILQLDLDIEIGDGGLHSSEDDRLSIDNIRVNTTPTFHIQNFGGRQVRSSSLASMSGIQREDLSERSQSSLSRINHMLDESIASKLFVQQSNNNKESKISTKSNGTKFLNPEDTKRDIDSISLPGTLQKFRTPDSCRGSNNCYMKATADLKQLASKIEKGCPKSRTTIIRHDNSDDEYLLANERNSQLEAGAAESSVIDIKIQVDDIDDIVK